MFERKQYSKWIEMVRNTEFIKVITGVRRSGKSMLLRMIEQKLLERGIQQSQIVLLNFENPQLDAIKTHQDLKNYISELKFSTKQKIYFLFDEIQEVDNWQKYINGLRVSYDCDIYITGSNAKLLSGELATYLSGRYIELKIFPLSFAEYLEFISFNSATDHVDMKFYDYIQWGGFPMLPELKNEDLKRAVLEGITDSIILKDVALRGEIRDKENLLKLVKFLLDTVGNSISAKKISDTLKTEEIAISAPVVERYLTLLTDALIFYKIQRYDIRGREHLKTQSKYYAVDTGLRNQQLGKIYRDNIGAQLENIVFLELKRRGYEVSIGKYGEKEIDFVARKPNHIEYYQVTYQIPQDSTREEDNLLMLPDNYKKTIVTANRMDVGNIGGIDVVHIVDFLLEEVNHYEL